MYVVISIDRKAHYRRPPSVMYSERKYAALDTTAAKTPPPSLAQLASKHVQQKSLASAQTPSKPRSLKQLASKPTQTTPSLSQLASQSKQTSSKPLSAGIASKPAQPTSLQGLANSALKSGKGSTSLQSLACSSLKSNNSNPTSLQSLAKKSTASGNMNSLKDLASRKQTTTAKPGASSLTALAQKSPPAKGPVSLVQLASRSSASAMSDKIKDNGDASASEPSESLEHKETKPEPVRELARDSVSPNQNGKDTSNTLSLSATKNKKDPLCAPPSSAAQFLFRAMDSDDSAALPAASKVFSESLAHSVDNAFFESIQTAAKNVKVFAFDVPSPDDIVLAAQSNRSGGAHSHTKA